MSTNVIVPGQEKVEEFDAAKFFADRNAREAAARAGKELPKVEDKPAEAEPAKTAKPTGDARKLFKTIRENGRLAAENESFKARLDALEKAGKPAEVKADPNAEPKRADYSTDQEFADARAEWKGAQGAEKVIKSQAEESKQVAEVKRISESFEAQMKAGADVDKGGYADWSELLKSSKAANVDIYAEAPNLFMAFMSSEYAKDVMHEWLVKPETLTLLIDTYKSDPMAALRQFHRFEGKVGREVEADKTPAKDEKKEPVKVAAVVEREKPRPSRSVQAPSGEAPAAEPAIGSAAWMAKRNAAKKERGW